MATAAYSYGEASRGMTIVDAAEGQLVAEDNPSD
jgi:hypothetical protein